MRSARIIALARRIIRQVLRDRRTLALLFLVPIGIMSLLGYLVNSPGGKVEIAIVNEDPHNDRLVRQLERFVREDESLELIDLKGLDPVSAAKESKIDGAVVLSPGFQAKLFSGEGLTVDVILEGSDPAAARSVLMGVGRIQQRLLASLASAQSLLGQQLTAGPPTIEPRYVYGGPEFTPTDFFAPVFVAFFVFFFVFLLTSVSFLRERAQGTMERILASPLTRSEIILGYPLGFVIFALAQSLIILIFVIFVLKIHYVGSPLIVFVVEVILTIGSVNLGIFLSTFAKNELQAVQFIPLVLVPQVLLSGIFWRVEDMPPGLREVAYVLPLTHANSALRGVMIKGFSIGNILLELGVLTAFALAMVILSVFALRRRVA